MKHGNILSALFGAVFDCLFAFVGASMNTSGGLTKSTRPRLK